MRKFHERQGKGEQRKVTRVRNRVGDNYDSRYRGESRYERSLVAQRDERRLLRHRDERLPAEAPVCAAGGVSICTSVGVPIPASGGVVSLGRPGSKRRVLHFTPSGQLASAHF